MAEPTDTYPADIAEYDIHGRIGKGAFAEVYKAYCRPAQINVAIKVIELEVEDSQEDIFAKVMNESTVMLQLSHDNIVSSLRTFTYDSEVWIVMPMLVASCADILKNSYPDGFIEEKWIARVFGDVVSGLEYIHRQNMVHRDLKSGNILLDHNGVARIADFGVSGSLVQELTAKKRMTVTGTPCWMAPEVAEHAAGHDSKADIWSLGITCLELIRGKPPYHAYTAVKAMMKILNDDPPTVERFVKKPTSNAFRLFVESCLQKDPKRRKTAKELKSAAFLQNPMQHGELAIILELTNEENPYQRNVNVDHQPRSLLRRTEEANTPQETTWIFTGDQNDLMSIVQEVNDQKKSLKTGQFLEVSDGHDWILARVLQNQGGQLQIIYLDQTSHWVQSQDSNIRFSKMEELFVTCQEKFPKFQQSGFPINPEKFRAYLFCLGLQNDLVNNALNTNRTHVQIDLLMSNFILWAVNNDAALTQIQPASQQQSSRFQVEPDSDAEEPQN